MRFIAAALLVLLFSSQLIAQKNEIPPDWPSFTDTAYNYSVRYPADWEFKQKNTNTRFFVTSYTENDGDKFRENINCIVRVLDEKGFTIKTAENAIKKSLSEKLQDYALLRSGYLTWNNSEALELEYTCTQTASAVSYSIHMLQRIAVVKGNLFTLTYTAEQKSYSRYIDTVKKVLASLRVK
ncbi:MAG: PsbP-related protein [Bacteroidota bacterium]